MCAVTFPFDQLYPKNFPSMKWRWHSGMCLTGPGQYAMAACSCGMNQSPLILLYQLHWASDQDFAICERNVRMRLGVLPLALFCSSVTVRESATHTPSMSHSTSTTIVLSCSRALNCKVQIWLWIFSPQIRAVQIWSLIWFEAYVREVGPGTPQRPRVSLERIPLFRQ